MGMCPPPTIIWLQSPAAVVGTSNHPLSHLDDAHNGTRLVLDWVRKTSVSLSLFGPESRTPHRHVYTRLAYCSRLPAISSNFVCHYIASPRLQDHVTLSHVAEVTRAGALCYEGRRRKETCARGCADAL
jgi:hypothetical protein